MRQLMSVNMSKLDRIQHTAIGLKVFLARLHEFASGRLGDSRNLGKLIFSFIRTKTFWDFNLCATHPSFLDRIIPSSWMDPVFRGQWRNLLRMDHGSTELGPNPNDVDDDTFLRNSLRCGRFELTQLTNITVFS